MSGQAARKRFIWVRLVFASASCIGLLAITPDAAVPSATAAHVNASSQDLARFRSSHLLNDLRAAVAALDGTVDIHTLTPNNFITTRRTLVQAWTNVLKVIEQAYDPTFNPEDPNNVPFLCPPVPPAGGRIMPEGTSSCMNPNDIKDARIRAAYVAAVKENDAKKSRLSYYLEILREDERAMSSLSATLDLLRKIAPEGVGRDFTALDGILQKAGLSQTRRTTIDAMIDGRPSP
jgi:hypothetical protein